MKRSGLVLCGGRSSRMGRPKAWLPWFGQTMIEHVVSTLAPKVNELRIVASPDLELPVSLTRDPKVQIVRDREADLGPLAGIREGLGATTGESIFVTSTDAPFLTADYIDAIFAQAEARDSAVAPVADGFCQVLSAVYPSRAFAKAEALLDEGIARPIALLEALGFEPADWSEGATSPPWKGFNTPDEFLAAVRQVAPDATAEVEVLGRLAVKLEKTLYRVPVGRLGEVVGALPIDTGTLVEDGRLAKAHLVSLGGRELVRNLDLPIGPDERVSLIDALAGG